MERKNKRGLKLILGATRANIERNILQPMRDIYGDSIATDINSKNYCKILGEKVYCIGADNVRQVAKIRGSEVAYCAIDEATDINKEVFEMLKSRLSLPWSCCDITTNPASPMHWFKEFIDSADRGVDIYCQDYTIYDNPFLPEEYIRSLEAEYAGTIWFNRYILGQWALAEGLVFPRHMEALYDDEFDGPADDYCISLDYGTSNPFAAILWEKRGKTWYGVDELYYSGKAEGVQKTDGEYLEELEKFAQPIVEYRKETTYKGIFINEDSFERIPVVVDPSAASFIALLRKSSIFSPYPADNSVINGIRDVNTSIYRGYIRIHRRCKNWQREAQSYVWNEKSEEDIPIKENDHLMDAMRYFVRSKHIVKRAEESVYKSKFGG